MNSAAFNGKDKTGNVLLARAAPVQLCGAKPALEVFAPASPRLLSFVDEGVAVPGRSWCGTAACGKDADSPARGKGVSARAGGAGARHSARVSWDSAGPLGEARRPSVAGGLPMPLV